MYSKIIPIATVNNLIPKENHQLLHVSFINRLNKQCFATLLVESSSFNNYKAIKQTHMVGKSLISNNLC